MDTLKNNLCVHKPLVHKSQEGKKTNTLQVQVMEGKRSHCNVVKSHMMAARRKNGETLP